MTSKHSWIRRSQRVIRMVSELHRMGYQRLRIFPYEYPLAWRLCIGSVADFSRHNGAFMPVDDNRSVTYSSASENHYFDWEDAASDTARDLAEKFVTRLPAITEAGKGRDWAYAGWLAELLGRLEEGDFLPIVTAEWMDLKPYSQTELPIRDYESHRTARMDFPLPPPGELDDDRSRFEGRSPPSGLLAALELAASSNYLGSPDVVTRLTSKFFETAVKWAAKLVPTKDLDEATMPVISALTGEDESYARLPGWHGPALGAAVIECFDLDPSHFTADDLGYVLSEGLLSVAYQARTILEGFKKDPNAQWDPDALLQINALHQYLVAILTGSHSVVAPGKKLADFVWQPVPPKA